MTNRQKNESLLKKLGFEVGTDIVEQRHKRWGFTYSISPSVLDDSLDYSHEEFKNELIRVFISDFEDINDDWFGFIRNLDSFYEDEKTKC